MEASNLQELKDAAIELMEFACNSCERRFCEEDVEEEDGQSVPSPCSAIIRMRNALSANPIRNCDVGTSDEQSERFKNFCRNHQFISVDSEDGFPPVYVCSNESCPLHGYYIVHGEDNCELAWAQMPYEANEKGDDWLVHGKDGAAWACECEVVNRKGDQL